MQLIAFQWIGLSQHFVKHCNTINANGVIFAPYYGAGKRKASNNGALERIDGESGAKAFIPLYTTTASSPGTTIDSTYYANRVSKLPSYNRTNIPTALG